MACAELQKDVSMSARERRGALQISLGRHLAVNSRHPGAPLGGAPPFPSDAFELLLVVLSCPRDAEREGFAQFTREAGRGA